LSRQTSGIEGTGSGGHFTSSQAWESRRRVTHACQAKVCGKGSDERMQHPVSSGTVSPMQSLSCAQVSGCGAPSSTK